MQIMNRHVSKGDWLILNKYVKAMAIMIWLKINLQHDAKMLKYSSLYVLYLKYMGP